MAALRTILDQSGRQKFAQSERISNKALGLGNASRAGTHLPLTSERWLEKLLREQLIVLDGEQIQLPDTGE